MIFDAKVMFQTKNINSMQRLFLFLFCVMLIVTGCEKDEWSGTEGTLTWTLSDDGTLTISGTGEMPDYQVTPIEFLPEWFEHRNEISNVIIDDRVSNIGNYAFFRCENLTSVTTGNSINAIGIRAFCGCSSLVSITIPNSVITIGDDAFAGCESLTSIIIPDFVTDIGNAAFYQCESLSSATIGNSVTMISDEAFFGCSSLSSVIIPNSVTNIGKSVFYLCENLTSISIGTSVTTIGEDAFRNCSSLTEFINHRTVPQVINEMTFSGLDRSKCTLFVPDDSIKDYQKADGWKDFTKISAIK